MGLKLLKDQNGNLRPTWYADLQRNGRTVRINLGVPVRGKPGRNADGNPTIHGGDRIFEGSRREAAAKMKSIRETAKRDSRDIAREAFRLRTGGDLEDVRLVELAARWRAIPRDPPATEEQLARADRIFADFAAFASSYTPPPDQTATGKRRAERCETLNAVTPDLAAAYFRHTREALAWATAAGRKHLLSSAWKTFATAGGANPFQAFKIRRDKKDASARTVHRSILDEAQLDRLFELAGPDPFLYPLIACAASTGLRLGDVCRLRWDAVEFRDGRPDKLKVLTAKTGEEVVIPVFERFAAVLERRLAKREAEARDGALDPLVYVFPEAARRYAGTGTQTGIVRAVKPLFARAVFGDEEAVADAEDAEPIDPAEVEDAIAAAPWKQEKRDRILDIYRRHARGESYRVIREATGRSSPLISQDLHAVELLVGRQVRPGAPPSGDSTREAMLARTRRRPEGRRRASSVYGWHSLRGTWATIALKRGVPKEAVAAVVGHATFKTTWEYYVAKEQLAEEARKGLRGSVLDGGKASPAPAPRLVSTPSKAPALPAVADPARALRYILDYIFDEDQRDRLGAAADAIGIDADNAAERLGLAARILAKDNQLDNALDGLRASRLLA